MSNETDQEFTARWERCGNLRAMSYDMQEYLQENARNDYWYAHFCEAHGETRAYTIHGMKKDAESSFDSACCYFLYALGY